MKADHTCRVTTRPWRAPEVRDYGTLADLTAVQHIGSVTDQAFPAGTPIQDLTFSTGH